MTETELLSPSSENVTTSFEYTASDDAAQVSLVGSWDQWTKEIPMLKQPDTTTWLVHLNLPPGPVTFKFFTDGKWVTTSTYDVVDDGFGGKNNRRVISEPAESAPLEEEEESIPGSDQTSDGRQEHHLNRFDLEKDKKQEDAVNCVIC